MAVPYQRHLKRKQQQQIQKSSFDFEELAGKPFWLFNKDEHLRLAIETNQQCCFNHIIGLPIKNGQEFPIFDYEEPIYNAIEENQNIWIKKSRGIGVTAFLIRYLVWKIVH